MDNYWYIIKVLPGKERQLSEQFNQQISSGKIENINRFVCPTEQEVVTTKKKKVFRDKVIYTGYLYFESKKKLDKSELEEIANIQNIMGMMGNKTPQMMSEQDVRRILKDEILENHIESKKLKYLIGDKIMVSEGPFTGFDGTIWDIKGDNIEATVKIFGRETKISLTLEQIKK